MDNGTLAYHTNRKEHVLRSIYKTNSLGLENGLNMRSEEKTWSEMTLRFSGLRWFCS